MGKSRQKPHTRASQVPAQRRQVEVQARNPKQRDYLRAIYQNQITFGLGSTGSGKTILASMSALRMFTNQEVEKIVLTRPNVLAGGEKHGFLPGNLDEKMDPLLRPIYDAFLKYWNVKTLEDHIYNKRIEICPIGYLRGRTFENACIIGDEMENATPEQMYLLLTRLGEGSKMIITGDPIQTDIRMDTLGDTIRRLRNLPNIGVVEFDDNDVERHPLVSDIVKIWNRTREVPPDLSGVKFLNPMDEDEILYKAA